MRQPLGVRPPDPLRVSPAQLARAQRWAIGTAVIVTKDNGAQIETVTQSRPWKLGRRGVRAGTWVILAEGLSGCAALARVVERAGE